MNEPADNLLKKDLFGQVSMRGSGVRRRIVRDVSGAPAATRWIARRLLAREARALAALDGTSGVPDIVTAGRDLLEREYLEGLPLQEARPADVRWYRDALRLLARLHRAGVVHNDLAKEPNWLVRPDGGAAVVDFQLAWHSPGRGRLFRLLAREDLRHLLKHKRTYWPDRLTARERAILAQPAWPSRLWRATGKPVYLFVTRRLLGWADREGAGDRYAERKP